MRLVLVLALLATVACGPKSAPVDPSDVDDVRVTVALRLTEIDSDSPKSMLNLVMIDERGETSVKSVREVDGICTPKQSSDPTELAVVSCWWRAATERIVAKRKGKVIEVRSADEIWLSETLPAGAVVEPIRSSENP